MQINLDGQSIPVRKLKGTDTTLDLSRKKLRDASAIVLATLLRHNTSLTSPYTPCMTRYRRHSSHNTSDTKLGIVDLNIKWVHRRNNKWRCCHGDGSAEGWRSTKHL